MSTVSQQSFSLSLLTQLDLLHDNFPSQQLVFNITSHAIYFIQNNKDQGWAAPAPELIRLLGAGPFFEMESEPNGSVWSESRRWSRSRAKYIIIGVGADFAADDNCRLQVSSDFFWFCLHYTIVWGKCSMKLK